MNPIVGKIYERYGIIGSLWGFERRLVLDVTNTQVLYEVLFEEILGTAVEHQPVREQVSIKNWKVWAELARET